MTEEEILYIDTKQIEEADLVVIRKSDLLDEGRLQALQSVLSARFPRKEILAVLARDGTNIERWFTRQEQGAGRAMDVDYEVNLRAEAAPDVRGTVVRDALAASAREFPTLKATLEHLEHFRPGKPTPTHRFQTVQ